MGPRTLAFIESPLQFLSLVESRGDDEPLLAYLRSDSDSLQQFVARLPEPFYRGITVSFGYPPARELDDQIDRVYIGDANSGAIQKLLIVRRPQFRDTTYVILDDGWSTVRAVQNISAKRPLIRARTAATPQRSLMGALTMRILRTAAERGRLLWSTALPTTQHLADRFESTGAVIRRHSYESTRSYDWQTTPASTTVILGSALPSDGLVDPEAYVRWVGDITAAGPAQYYPHRRETEEIRRGLAQIPNLEIVDTSLPVEIQLSSAPAGVVIYSLPSTALATLPLILNDPAIRLKQIPAAWWTHSAPDSLREELNSIAQARQKPTDKPRLVAISDSESYLKWAAHLCDQLRTDFDIKVWLIDNPILPTAEQVRNAVSGTMLSDQLVPVIPAASLRQSLVTSEPDVVLAAATGPVVQNIYAAVSDWTTRPGLVSGLPGVGLPATAKGQRYRRLGDMFIVHSRKEQTAYEDAIAKVGAAAEVVVTRMPMLTSVLAPNRVFTGRTVPRRLVFAPQAKVPVERADRIRILKSLAEFRRNFPASEVIVKVRSRPGEQETHRDQYPYAELLAQLIDSGDIRPDEIRVEVGALSAFLTRDSALVTVSSTAALEALDKGLPTFIISDFGVNDEMLNGVFEDSGITASLAQLERGEFMFPTEQWLVDNYFQPPSAALRDALLLLAKRSQTGQLPQIKWAARRQSYRKMRAAVRMRTPKPVVDAYRRVRYRQRA